MPMPADGDVLDGMEPLEGARALVIGHGALETICGLIRRGCTAATEVPVCDRRAPDPDSADIVIVPDVGSVAEARTAMAMAARVLVMGGHIAFGDGTGALGPEIADLLRAHGFCTIRSRDTRAGTVVTAERPMFGPLHWG